MKASLSSLQCRLMRYDADIKWVKPCHMHISIKFLGNINDYTVNRLKNAVLKITESCPVIKINISGVGILSDSLQPRVIRAGVDNPPKELANLYRHISCACENEGLPVDKRPFLPHISLGRIRKHGISPELAKAIENESGFTAEEKITVKKIGLFSSLLTQAGPQYLLLEEFRLAGAGKPARPII
ncbi:MAG: RNA 2',3'-cyclic phosphodiesterase [Candidatus Omnitrophica bacterium]|nr:RNA 2',3'-cyclic phosphodiesterase [Candidatus Omnitrophota bacterium]